MFPPCREVLGGGARTMRTASPHPGSTGGHEQADGGPCVLPMSVSQCMFENLLPRGRSAATAFDQYMSVMLGDAIAEGSVVQTGTTVAPAGAPGESSEVPAVVFTCESSCHERPGARLGLPVAVSRGTWNVVAASPAASTVREQSASPPLRRSRSREARNGEQWGSASPRRLPVLEREGGEYLDEEEECVLSRLSPQTLHRRCARRTAQQECQHPRGSFQPPTAKSLDEEGGIERHELMNRAAFGHIWRKQVPFLYDLLVVHRRKPAVTAVVWPPGLARVPGSTLQRLFVGTDAGGGLWQGDGELLILSIQLPADEVEDSSTAFAAGSEAKLCDTRVHITHRMKHEGPVRRIECSPHRQFLLATQAAQGDVLIFDASRWEAPLKAASAGEASACSADARLRAPLAKEFLQASTHGALAWSPQVENQLVSSTVSGAVCLWDASAGSCTADFIGPVVSPITGLAFCPMRPTLIASCCADGHLCLWDARAGNGERPVAGPLLAHVGGARCVAFAKGVESPLLATGGADGAAQVRDVRRLDVSLHTLSWSIARDAAGAEPARRRPCHAVSEVAWAPVGASTLARCSGSCSALATAEDSGRVLIWDLSSAGSVPQPSAEAVDGPPELTFVHGGHVGCPVTCLAWSPDQPGLLASASASPAPVGGNDDPGATSRTGLLEPGELQLWRAAEAANRLPLL